MFYGLGSDGTVGANKNSIKIIGETTDNYVQGYFVYDSKKAGAQTVSHLRFGPKPIYSTYLIHKADFIACHQFNFIEKYDILKNIKKGGTFLLNAPFSNDEIWDKLPQKMQESIEKAKLLSAMSKALPGVEKGNSIIEGADTFVLSNNAIHSYNDNISVSVPFDLDESIQDQLNQWISSS